MLIDGSNRKGFVPYPAATSDEREAWRAAREASRSEIEATAIRARENWYEGGYDVAASEAGHADEGSLLNLADHEPADRTSATPADRKTTTPDLIETMPKTTPKRRKLKPKPSTTKTTLHVVISDLDREIARLTEARERLTAIEGNTHA